MTAPADDSTWLRFATKVDFSGPCWEWLACVNACGYGSFKVRTKVTSLAHRFAYEHLVGEIRDGLTLDHLCRNRRCVNPDHLEPVTAEENRQRAGWGSRPMGPAARNAAKTECLRGHEFTSENTYVNKRGSRVCRTCMRAHQLAWNARRDREGQSC